MKRKECWQTLDEQRRKEEREICEGVAERLRWRERGVLGGWGREVKVREQGRGLSSVRWERTERLPAH